MTKKKEELPNTTGKIYEDMSRKKKEDPFHGIVWKHRIKGEIIDTPSITRMTSVPMKDPIMNMLCYMMTGKDLDDL